MSDAFVPWLEVVAGGALPLLVATGLEGVIAPLSDDDDGARARFARASLHLNRLARTPGVTVAVISGHALEQAAAICGELRGCHVWAEHGSVLLEPGGRVRVLDPPGDPERATTLVCLAVAFADRTPGLVVEPKLGGVVVDHSGLPADARARFLAAFRREVWDRGAQVQEHHDRVEARARCGDKGLPLRWLAAQPRAPSAAILAGDDASDEAAYRALGHFEHAVGFHVRSEPRPRPEAPGVAVVEGADRWVELLGLLGETLAGRGRRLV